MHYAKHVSQKVTPQSEQAKSTQQENHAGGFSFVIDKWSRLDRFLILGCEGSTYYQSERSLTKENAKCVQDCLAEDGARAVQHIVDISLAGRAPKNDAAIFALAVAAADSKVETVKAALSALPQVCRIGTHLFQFMAALKSFRGNGRLVREAVAKWYTDKKADKLAMQVLKYQSRKIDNVDWSHRDLLRLSHTGMKEAPTPAHGAIFRWIVTGEKGLGARDVTRKLTGKTMHYDAIDKDAMPALLSAYTEMKSATDATEVVKLIKAHGFTREMVPTEHLNDVRVWEALLEDMPMTAMIRNLGKMSKIGLLKPLSAASQKIVDTLSNTDALKKARVHPIALLSALKVYEQGHGERGSLTWTPEQKIVDGLNEAFYASFDLIEPTNKNWLLALDISGSMDGGEIAGVPGLTPRIASAAMAMVVARTEKNWHVIGYTAAGSYYGGSHQKNPDSGVTTIKISPKQRLDEVVKVMQSLPMGGTDCALPILWAMKHKIEVDVFASFTDNETWAGAIHPFQALKQYRKQMGRPAKLIAVGMTATDYSIADESDPGMMNVVGFDSAAIAVMQSFAKQ
jgi:60 kDa SS-A/Ro ribonucleoprotein